MGRTLSGVERRGVEGRRRVGREWMDGMGGDGTGRAEVYTESVKKMRLHGVFF